MITIITVVYNDYFGLLKTISSVQDQNNFYSSGGEFEHLIVDGGSGDSRIVSLLQESNLKYISEKDNGIYDAMNKGISIAQGQWVYFLNSGDVFDSKDALSNILDELGRVPQEVNMLYGAYRADGVLQSQNCTLPFLISHMINHQSMIYHRSLLEHGYDIRYRFCADYAHLLSVWPRLKPKALDLCIANFDTTGVSSQASNKARMWQERLQAVWRSDLNIFQKIFLSSRGIIAWPYHVIKIKMYKVR